MILEPNCSIIAACLPCFGPLVAGGRAPESLIRSVRSVLSIRSRSSRAGSDKSRSQNSNDNASRESRSKKAPSDSQIELASVADDDEVWAKSQAGRNNTVNVQRSSLPTAVDDEEAGQGQGIYMAKQYDVTRSQV